MAYRAVILLTTLLFLLPSVSRAQESECDGTVIDVMPAERLADVYVAVGQDTEIREGDVLKVFRPMKVSGETGVGGRIEVYVGRLQIIDVQESVAIGRMLDFAPRDTHPRVRYEAVMIGDCVVLEPKPEEPKTPESKEVEQLPAAPVEGDLAEGISTVSRVVPTRIRFETDSSRIQDEWKDELDQLAAFIIEEKPAQVIVEGHADARGTDSYNLGLSERRARAVVDYLVQRHGIERRIFIVKAYGERVPVASNESPEGRQRNRRANIVILVEAPPVVEVPAKTPSPWPPIVEPERLLPEETEIPKLPTVPDSEDPEEG
ncbi:MAG: hypothetical protein Kow0099_26300 [Candidatus Abyssubacteria bacterium]